jgi:circadian clock protein KaiC
MHMPKQKKVAPMSVADTVFPTAISGLDTLLGGGLSHPALAVIVGAPGAGKTILASQIIFEAARQGHKAIIFTSFSEGITQYLQHMRSLAFFDAAVVGEAVQLFTLVSQINTEDASPAAAIARTIRATSAKVVLLDGFQGIESFGITAQTTRALLATLATQIRYLGVTLLITIAGAVHDLQFYEEMTVADIAIGLDYTTQGRRHQRLVEIVKLRGREHWGGLHSYRIDKTGIHVFPRIEGYTLPNVHPATTERAPFLLPELDRLLSGGPNIGTTTVLAGAPGVGKTTLGLHWAVATAQPDASSLFLSFAEHVEQLEQKAAAFGLDLSRPINEQRVRVVRLSAVDLNPDEIANLILTEITTAPVRRLVIDDITVLLHEVGERTRDYLAALNDLVYGRNITSLYLLEIAPFEGLRLNVTNTPLALLGDNVIVVQQYEIQRQLRRFLAVLRMRLSFFDRTLRELVLDEQGIRIVTPQDADMGLLETGAKLSGGIAPQADADEKPPV